MIRGEGWSFRAHDGTGEAYSVFPWCAEGTGTPPFVPSGSARVSSIQIPGGTRLGLPLTKGSVEEVLRNRVYSGVTVWRPGTPDEEIRPGSHEPIITHDEWEAIERIRDRRTTRCGRRPVGRSLSRVRSCPMLRVRCIVRWWHGRPARKAAPAPRRLSQLYE